MASPTVQGGNARGKSVLMICWGNICRSPTAEAVFQAVVNKAGQSSIYTVDSCGTGGGNPDWYMENGWSHHEGNPADERMSKVAAKRGVTLTSRSRPLTPADLEKFDYLVAMDEKNARDIITAVDYWRGREFFEKQTKAGIPSASVMRTKVLRITDYCQMEKHKKYDEVPDPYFGGMAGFELVLDLLEDACAGLVEEMNAGKK
jgi:protein-tyrosine phosphatase